MTGVKGRSGRKPDPGFSGHEAMSRLMEKLPTLFTAAIKKAEDGDKDCIIYLIDRALGRPKIAVDARMTHQVALTADDIVKIVQEIKAQELAVLSSPVVIEAVATEVGDTEALPAPREG